MGKAYLARETLGDRAFEAYQTLGKSIRRDTAQAQLDMLILAEKSDWDWQTVRRIMVGSRRTDFVEVLIIASLLSENQAEAEKLILTWAHEVLSSIHPSIPAK